MPRGKPVGVPEHVYAQLRKYVSRDHKKVNEAEEMSKESKEESVEVDDTPMYMKPLAFNSKVEEAK